MTFDFWNTLYSADGGTWTEVAPYRMGALRDLLAAAGKHPSDTELDRVYRSGFDAYMQSWTNGCHFGAREQAHYFLGQFGVAPDDVDPEAIERAVIAVEESARRGRLPLVAGAAEVIPRLSEAGYKLGLISDTSLTPGRILKEFMRDDGLLEHFSFLTFSDETGYCKPDSRMFLRTLEGLGSGVARAAHVGDTPRTDIAGAQAVGMIAVRCAAVNDDTEEPAAHYVIRDHRELLPILGLLD